MPCIPLRRMCQEQKNGEGEGRDENSLHDLISIPVKRERKIGGCRKQEPREEMDRELGWMG
jgi:hypothetical protein